MYDSHAFRPVQRHRRPKCVPIHRRRQAGNDDRAGRACLASIPVPRGFGPAPAAGPDRVPRALENPTMSPTAVRDKSPPFGESVAGEGQTMAADLPAMTGRLAATLFSLGVVALSFPRARTPGGRTRLRSTHAVPKTSNRPALAVQAPSVGARTGAGSERVRRVTRSSPKHRGSHLQPCLVRRMDAASPSTQGAH
jgi:hypothetical protein